METNTLPTHRIVTPPGKMLLEGFLKPMEITQSELAEHLGVTLARINEIIRGRRGITADTAWLLAGALGTTPDFWLNAQMSYDITRARPKVMVKRMKKAA